MLKLNVVFFLAFASLVSLNIANADEGDPIAIRHWPDGRFTVETMWDLHVGVGIGEDLQNVVEVKPDFEVLTATPFEMQRVFRLPNESTIGQEKYQGSKTDSRDIVTVNVTEPENSVMGMYHRGPTIFANGAAIEFLHRSDPKQLCETFEALAEFAKELEKFSPKKRKKRSILNVVVVNSKKFGHEECLRIAKSFEPEIMVVHSSIKTIGGKEVELINHNTLAVSSKTGMDEATRFVALGTTPYEMSDEVSELFAKKEASQKLSREMFAKLSVEQLNFKPANGSHTPRWNTEHMMGRELLFFSQIYNAVDPSIPVMDLNPKQMPKDYKFAHPDWTGEEEARQMKRVENFTRRFAYLLDGMDLDKKAKGSRFAPRKLLMQMERHYTEHSANVVKKMELDGWPKK